MSSEKPLVSVAGGGVIGLSIAWELARAGNRVEVHERREVGMGSSWAAAGVLSPAIGVDNPDTDIVRLCAQSAEMYPQWVAELERESGVSVHYTTEGTLIAGMGVGDKDFLKKYTKAHHHLGHEIQRLTGTQLRQREPLLSDAVTDGIWGVDDHKVDSRRLLLALRRVCVQSGVTISENSKVEKIDVVGYSVDGIVVNGTKRKTDIVVIAAGCWSGGIEGLPEELVLPLRPVKGQMVSVQMTDSQRISHAVYGSDVHLIPKYDGTMLIGGTVEESDFETQPTAGNVHGILERGVRIAPGIADLAFVDTWTGLRPATPDDKPILGRCGVEGLHIATGHFRKGILLAPITAKVISKEIADEEPYVDLTPFLVSRFEETGQKDN